MTARPALSLAESPPAMLLPARTDCEAALIGAILTDSAAVLPQLGMLAAEDFHHPAHADIYQAVLRVHEAGDKATPFTTPRFLKSPELLAHAGGASAYLLRSMKNFGTTLFPADDARLLRRLAQKRRIIAACMETAEQAARENDDAEPETHIAALKDRLQGTDMQSGTEMFSDAYAVTQRIMDELKTSRAAATSTGLPRLDTAMEGGLYPGRAYGFAARKKVGKTALAATLSGNLNAAGVKHLFICGEMSSREVQQRVLARYGDCYTSAFRSGYSHSDDFAERMNGAVSRITNRTLYADAPGLTFSDLRRICTVAVERHRVQGIILDYWQLVGGKERNKSTAEHLDEVAQWFANFGRRHGIWSITMAQINQDGNTRGSEGIRLACDQLFVLHRADLTLPDAWLEMIETRHTKWLNVGSTQQPALLMNEKGPFFEEAQY